MCSEDKPTLKHVISNLRQPMPFWRKAGLVVRNNMLKILRFKNCCGHAGQPGCWKWRGTTWMVVENFDKKNSRCPGDEKKAVSDSGINILRYQKKIDGMGVWRKYKKVAEPGDPEWIFGVRWKVGLLSDGKTPWNWDRVCHMECRAVFPTIYKVLDWLLPIMLF